MMARVFAIALNTFREAIRNKILYGIVAAVLAMNGFALVLGEMSLHEEARVARDAGLAGISLFGAVTAIVLGVSLLYNEIQKKTIHTILSKPLERHEFVLGKFIGMAITLTLLVAAFTLALFALLALRDVPFDARLGKAVLLGWMEVLLVAALAVFFSSFASPFSSGVFTFALWFLGRVSPEIRAAAARGKEEWIRLVSKGALAVVPDFHLFAVSGSDVAGQHVSVHGSFVGWEYMGMAALYGVAWMGGLLIVAMVVFRRRDFA